MGQHAEKPRGANAHHEGLARGISQALTYVFELHKTAIQVHGKSPTWTSSQWILNIARGIWQSSLTAGFVFHTYFSVYHSVSATHASALASPIAAFITSGIKIPIGNCMRVVQASPKIAPTIVHAGIAIAKNNGIRGLYSGYVLSLIEDIIEMDVRIRLYDAGVAFINTNTDDGGSVENRTAKGFAVGAAAGAVAAAITTPFDTLRARLAFQACHSKTNQTGTQILAELIGQHNQNNQHKHVIGTLFRGVRIRTVSTGIKAALFYAILEGFQSSNLSHAST